jgi:enoyl-CoA hydratase/carnithine racemase|tara:strand:- start:2019 stop:2879 length:861 start_codon:yes stop_codon:yes gene_type:complete
LNLEFAGYDTEIAYRVKTEVRPKQKDDSKGVIMSYIITETNQQCLTITLNRTDKKNALTRDMYQEMANAILGVKNDGSTKVVVIKGAGDCFTAGNDIGDFAQQQDHAQVPETAAFMRALAACNLPVIAQVHGLAVGIGTTLLLHCDFVYATPDTRFVLPFINLGLVPEYASSYLLPKVAGHIKAAEWLMLGEPFTSADAYQFGILTKIVDAHEIDQTVQTTVEKLVAKPSFSLKQTKALLKGDGERTNQQMNEEFDIFLEALGTTAAQEAFDAFLKKRPINPEKFK